MQWQIVILTSGLSVSRATDKVLAGISVTIALRYGRHDLVSRTDDATLIARPRVTMGRVVRIGRV
jgi:hypothetical protein